MAVDDLVGLMDAEMGLPPPVKPEKPLVSLNDLEEDPFGETEAIRKGRAAEIVVGNQDAEPKKSRKSVLLGNRYMANAALIDEDQEAWEKELKVGENIRIAGNNKAVRNFLLSDPMALRASYDDLPVLDKITTFISDAWMFRQEFNPFVNPQRLFTDHPGEKAAKPFKAVKGQELEEEYGAKPSQALEEEYGEKKPAEVVSPHAEKPSRVVGWSDAFVEGQENFHLGRLKVQYQNTPEAERPALKLKIDTLIERIAQRPESRASYVRELLGGFLGQAYESLPRVGVSAVGGAVTGTAIGTMAGAGTGPAAPVGVPIGAIAGFTTGTVAGVIHGFSVVAAQQSAGNIFYEVDKIEGLSEAEKQTMAVAGGLAVGMLESWGGHLVHTGIQQIISRVAGTEAGKTALKEFMLVLGKNQLEGGIINGGQQLAEILAEHIGRAKGEKDLATIFNDKEETAKMVKDVSKSFLDGLVLASFIGGPAAMARGTRTGDAAAAARALSNQKKIDELIAMGEESQLKKESPNLFAKQLEFQEPNPTLQIEPALVLQYKDKFNFIPDIDKQLADSQALGTEIKVKQSDLLAHLDPATYLQIRDGIRVSEDSMTPQEAYKAALKEQARAEIEAAKAQEEAAIAQGIEPTAIQPPTAMSDADLIAGIFGAGPTAPQAAPQMPQTLQLPQGEVQLPPQVVNRGQSLIDRVLGRRPTPTPEQMAAYIQAENIRNLQGISSPSPLQQASVSPTPEALSVPPQPFTETTAARPETPPATAFPPAADADKVVKLDAEIGKAATVSLLDQFRAVMASSQPTNLGEAVLARALSRGPGNMQEFRRFIKEEAEILEITEPKQIREINHFADAAMAALGTRLLKEETASVTNGLTDPDAKSAAVMTGQLIDHQRAVMALTPLFEVGEGMTPAKRANYEQHIQDVQTQLTDAVFSAAREITEKKETRRWNDQKAAMRPEVEEYIAETPAIVADEYFRTGHSRALGDQGVKLQMTREQVDAVFSPEELAIMEIKSSKLSNSVLMKGQKWAKQGAPDSASPDAMGMVFGYPTGEEMLLDLMAYRASLRAMKETQEARFERLVDEEINRRMMAQYGDLNKIIEKNVEDAALNIAQERVLRDEMDALSTLSGKGLIYIPELRTLVDERMRDMTNAQATNAKEYQNLAGKHGLLAKEAKEAGDYATALEAKKLQMQAIMMADWAIEHRKEVTLGRQMTARITRSARVEDYSAEVNTRMLQLIAQSGLDPGKRTIEVLQNDIAGMEEPSLSAWIEEKNNGLRTDGSNANTIPSPTYLGAPTIPLKDINEMKVKYFKEFYDTLRALEFVGKKEQLVGERGKQLHMDAVMATIAEQVADLSESRGYEKFGDPVQPKRGIIATYRGYIGNLLRAETVAMKVDRLRDDGILNRVLITPLKDAQKAKNDMKLEIGDFLRNFDHGERSGPPGHRMSTLGRLVPNDSIMAPNGKPREFRADEMLVVALNWGNATNRQLMANTLKTDQGVVNDWLMKNMTKANWDFVENIWKMYGQKLNPARDKTYQNTRGFGMEYPDPISFVDAHGVSRTGGYYPIIKLATEGVTEGKQRSEVGLIDTRVHDALPSNSHRQFAEASKNGKEINLSLNLHELQYRIEEDIHEITHREAIQNASKIVNDPRFYKAVHDSFGKAQADIFKPWIAGIANSGGKANQLEALTIRWISSKIQTNMTTNLVGFNPATMGVHSPTAMMNSIGEAGLYTYRALRAEIGDSKLNGLLGEMFKSKDNFDEMVGYATRNSAELPTRIRDKRMDIGHSLGLWGKYESFQYNSEWMGQAQIAYTDYASAAFVWWAGFIKAQDEGFSLHESHRLGDRMIRLAHNSSNLMDKSAFTTDKALRPFAQFYGFFNHVTNQLHLKGFRTAEGARAAAKSGSAGDFAEMGKALTSTTWTAMSATWFYVAALGFIHHMIRGESKEDEFWGVTAAKEIVGVLTGALAIVREPSYAVLHGDYAKAAIPFTAAMDVPRRWWRDMKSYVKKVELENVETWRLPPAQTSFELAGIFLGVKLTTKQMGRWAEEMQRISRGEVPPPDSFTEWRRLYMYGRSHPIGARGGRPSAKWY